MTQNPYEPQYPPQQAQYPPAGPPQNASGFMDPTEAGSGGDYPSQAQLIGRLLIIWPKSVAKVTGMPVPTQPGQAPQGPTMRDRITADVAVLDGEPFAAKLDQFNQPKVVFPAPITIPTEFPDMYLSGSQLVTNLADALAVRGMVLARLTRSGPPGQTPYKLLPATDADRALGQQYLSIRAQVQAQRAAAPQAGPAQPAAQPYPQQAQQFQGQPAAQPYPQQVPQEQYRPPAGPPGGWAPQAPVQGGWPQQG